MNSLDLPKYKEIISFDICACVTLKYIQRQNEKEKTVNVFILYTDGQRGFHDDSEWTQPGSAPLLSLTLAVSIYLVNLKEIGTGR